MELLHDYAANHYYSTDTAYYLQIIINSFSKNLFRPIVFLHGTLVCRSTVVEKQWSSIRFVTKQLPVLPDLKLFSFIYSVYFIGVTVVMAVAVGPGGAVGPVYANCCKSG